MDNDSLNDTNYSLHSSDFEYVDDSDPDDRGLDFKSLPTCNTMISNRQQAPNHSKYISIHARNFKYPCTICLGPCKENIQDSICCSICDEWTHQKCSNLSVSQFKEYCLPANSELPYYCDNCLFGSRRTSVNQTWLRASEIRSFDT